MSTETTLTIGSPNCPSENYAGLYQITKSRRSISLHPCNKLWKENIQTKTASTKAGINVTYLGLQTKWAERHFDKSRPLQTSSGLTGVENTYPLCSKDRGGQCPAETFRLEISFCSQLLAYGQSKCHVPRERSACKVGRSENKRPRQCQNLSLQCVASPGIHLISYIYFLNNYM